MEHTNTTARENRSLAVLALIAGLIFDCLFYGKTIGISHPLFVVVFYCLFAIAFYKQLSFHVDFGWFLFVPILLLSATFAIYSNPVLMVLNFLLIPPLLCLQTTLLVYKREWTGHRFIVHFLGCLLRQVAGMSVKVFLEIISARKIATKITSEEHRTFRSVLIGLIISAPLLVVVIALLAEADTVFQTLIANILEPLETVTSIPFTQHVTVVGIITILLFGYLAVVLRVKVEGASAPAGKDAKGWDVIVVATVLAMVNAVYILFCLIQFAYLFGGEENIRSVPDYTYAEYARRGFFELIVITVINLTILLIGLRFTRTEERWDRLVLTLRCLLVLCTVIILYSAHLRLKLYEEAYGYTYARIFAHTVIAFLLILFMLTFYKLWRTELPLVKAFAIAALLAYITLNYINVDTIVARKNIDRYIHTGKVDLEYLQELSYDAIPELIRLSYTGGEDTTAKQMAVFLREKRSELRSESPWQSYNLSKAKARYILSEIRR